MRYVVLLLFTTLSVFGSQSNETIHDVFPKTEITSLKTIATDSLPQMEEVAEPFTKPQTKPKQATNKIDLNDPVYYDRSLPYGAPIDSLNGVYVFKSKGKGPRGKRRHLAEDGYNLGLKWQCVEFVKRYYYEHYGHKMPNDRGHAKSFYNKKVKDGEMNEERGLRQFSKKSKFKPEVGQIIVFRNNNPFGHVAIISYVCDDRIEIIEQNSSMTRREYPLEFDGTYYIIKPRNSYEVPVGRLGF